MVDEPDWLHADRLDALEELDVRTNGAVPLVTVEELLESWPAIDLGPVLRGEVVRVEPVLLARDDGRCLLYAARVNSAHGDSGIGKSWVATVAAAQVLQAAGHVSWVDLEDDAGMLVERLRLLGLSDGQIEAQLHYHRPTEFFSVPAVALIASEVQEHDVALVVIDSVGEAFGLEGLNENDDTDATPWYRRVARALADTGAAVLLIDHGTKAADNPLHPSGSKRKRAAVTGASYLIEAPTPLTREHGGRVRLTCAKDRHGHYRRAEVVAEIEFTPYPDGGMTVHVWPPTAKSTSTPDARLLAVARAAVRACEEARRPLSGRELVELIPIKASAATKRAAIDRAIAGGALRTEDGPRRSVLHVYVCDLESPT